MKYLLRHLWQRSFFAKSISADVEFYHSLSEEYLIEAYNDAFIKLFRRAITYSPFYRHLYGSYGLTKETIKDIREIHLLPEITKQDIIDSPHSIFSGIPSLRFKGNTSGTTGSPLTTYRTPLSISIEMAYKNIYREVAGFIQGEPLVSIRGALGKKELYYHDSLSNTLYISGPNLNHKTIHTIHRLVYSFNAKAIEAFPSYLHKFLELMDRFNLTLEIPLVFTSSEMLYEFQTKLIQSKLNAVIYDWYGNVERTIALAQDSNGRYKPLPLYAINEYKKNTILTTGLNNYYYPLIRYRVDDVIETVSSDFMTNLINPEIISINGRAGDVIELPDGSSVGCIDHAFKGIQGLKQAQVHQFSNKNLEVWINTSKEYNHSSEQKLLQHLKFQLGNQLHISIHKKKQEQFIQQPGKKYRLIIKHQETVDA